MEKLKLSSTNLLSEDLENSNFLAIPGDVAGDTRGDTK